MEKNFAHLYSFDFPANHSTVPLIVAMFSAHHHHHLRPAEVIIFKPFVLVLMLHIHRYGVVWQVFFCSDLVLSIQHNSRIHAFCSVSLSVGHYLEWHAFVRNMGFCSLKYDVRFHQLAAKSSTNSIRGEPFISFLRVLAV